mmetsp:Transcript_24872/g.68582  ORF Transcript_24872/g.68582 Transcript_24872/m.68582 type:complete len:298 (-) Transcript_24872:426-1319(-)
MSPRHRTAPRAGGGSTRRCWFRQSRPPCTTTIRVVVAVAVLPIPMFLPRRKEAALRETRPTRTAAPNPPRSPCCPAERGGRNSRHRHRHCHRHGQNDCPAQPRPPLPWTPTARWLQQNIPSRRDRRPAGPFPRRAPARWWWWQRQQHQQRRWRDSWIPSAGSTSRRWRFGWGVPRRSSLARGAPVFVSRIRTNESQKTMTTTIRYAKMGVDPVNDTGCGWFPLDRCHNHPRHRSPRPLPHRKGSLDREGPPREKSPRGVAPGPSRRARGKRRCARCAAESSTRTASVCFPFGSPPSS